MATSTLVPVSEYLSTDYSPDCDYVDGEVLERNVGEQDHSNVQMALAAFLFNRRQDFGIHVFPEQRIRISPTRFRVPDICVVAGPKPSEQIFTSPPFLAVEILSPEDRWSRMLEKVEDYLSFGIGYVWLIDPRAKRGWVCTPGTISEAKDGILRTENPSLEVPLTELFA